MRRTVAGIPVWALAVIGLGGGYWYYRKRQAAAQTSAAAAQQATSAAAAPSQGSGEDSTLIAYQAGEASGVSTYESGVATGLSLVDSIVGMFPASQGANTAAAQAASTTTSTGASVPTPANKPPANPYPVGTTVAPGEKVTQAVDAGPYGTVDVTSKWGLYTVPGVAVSGSLYAPNASGPATATVSGDTVTERTPKGSKVFTLSGKPAA